MEYILAIDGGSSKTEFALAKLSGEIVRSVVIEKGSNPWKYKDFADVEAIIRDGIEQLDIDGSVASCVAGISGCHGDSLYAPAFKHILMPYLHESTKLFITGDILSSFNALSDEPAGLVAINGSGSSITLVYADNSTYVFDAVGIAGRDIAMNIIMSADRGFYSQQVKEWCESILGSAINHPTLETLYHTPGIFRITKALSQLNADHPIRTELTPYLYSVAVRWSTKIWGASMKYRNVTKIGHDKKVPVVLNGSVWQFDFIRETTIELLKGADPHLSIRYDPSCRPITGVIKLAQRLIDS